MQTEREHVGRVGEDGGGAVALVDIAVDDGDAPDPALCAHGQRGDGGVIEYTKTRAEIAVRVVRAAGHVGRATVLKCATAGGQRGAGRAA